MCDLDIQIAYERLHDDLIPRLRGRVFHVTCLDRLTSILEQGAITPNPDGERPSAFGSADASLCRRRGAVSVFDYRAVSDGQLATALDACAPYQPAWGCDYGLAVLFLGREAVARLAGWHDVPPIERGRFMFVPYVESCHPGPIPADQLDEILRVRVIPPANAAFMDVLRSAAGRPRRPV